MSVSTQDLPRGLTGDQLIQSLNDRLRQIVAQIPSGPATENLNMNGFLINQLGDPHGPQDAVNLRYADARYAQITPAAPVSKTPVKTTPAPVVNGLPFVTPDGDFGAKGDGVTDDTTAVQAALNSGRAVVLKEDAVFACSSLTLPTGLSLFGFPGSKIAQIGGSASALPFITNAHHVGGDSSISIEGVTFDGQSPKQSLITGINADLLFLYNVLGIRLRNCSFLNAMRGCVYGSLLTDIEIAGCSFSRWGVGNVGAIYLASRAGNNFGGPGGAITGVNIHDCVVDGRPSHSSCIKLDADAANSIQEVTVSGNRCHPGDASATSAADTSTLGIELYSGTPGTSSILTYSIDKNIVVGENATGPNIFGISQGGAGCINGAVKGNVLANCNAFGIETIGQSITVSGNALLGCGESTIDSGSANCGQITIADNVFYNPKTLFGFTNAIHVIAHSTSGPGPYSISNVAIRGNTIASLLATNNNLIIIESQLAGYSIKGVKVSDNFLVGSGPGLGSGLSIGPNAGICDYLTIQDNFFQDLAVAINPGGTNSRYLFNRYKNVATIFGGPIAADAILLDIDGPTPNFTVQSLLVRGMPTPLILPNGDISIPVETVAILSGAAAQENPSNPNVVAWNGVNFGTVSQGGFFSVNSRWAGGGNWVKTSSNASNRAMFIGLGAGRFSVMFGNANNPGGATPGTSAFYVDDNGGGTPTVNINANIFPGLAGNLTLQTDVTGKVIGVTPVTGLGPGSVTLADMATLAAQSIIGNSSGSPATPVALTEPQVAAMIAPSLFPAWTAYSPTVTGFSSFLVASYRGFQIGKTAFVRIWAQGVSNASAFSFTLPYAPLDVDQAFAVTVFNGGTGTVVATFQSISGSTITLSPTAVNGLSYTVMIQGVYETT